MTADDGTARAVAPGSPVLFIVDADPQARVVVESALTRRFGPDYRVLTVGHTSGGAERTAASGRPRRRGRAGGSRSALARHGRR